MKILTNTITILAEIAALILSIIWYNKAKEEEPLIAIILAGGALITSLVAKFTIRPRVVMHHNWTSSGRNPQGYTANNPPVIRVGIDNPQMFWRLSWNYDLEIRNNSSRTAYDIQINYINLPEKTFIEGSIGKIEPLQPHELREFKIKIVQNITGTYIDADKYLEESIKTLTGDVVIHIKYKDETGFAFSTKYFWAKAQNKFYIS